MQTLISLITNDKIKGIIAIVTAVVMYFTPDYIDAIIQTCLAAFGISKLTITAKE